MLIGDPTLRVNICSVPMAIDDLAGTLTGDNIHLEWTEPYSECGVTRYVVYRSTAPGSLGDSLAGTVDTVYTDMGAAGDVGSNYFYAVKAVDAGGQKSGESNKVGEFDRDLDSAK